MLVGNVVFQSASGKLEVSRVPLLGSALSTVIAARMIAFYQRPQPMSFGDRGSLVLRFQDGSVVITNSATRVVLSVAEMTASSGELLKDVLLVVKNMAPRFTTAASSLLQTQRSGSR